MRDVGKNIRKLREQKQMTQEALSEALFVTRQTVSNYETGRSRPDVDMLVRIAEVLDTDVNTLIYGPPTPASRKTAIRRLFVALGIFAVLSVGYFLLFPYVKSSANYRYNYLPAYFMNLLCKPLLLFTFGWLLMHSAGLLLNARPLDKTWVKYARTGLIAVFVFLAVEIIPFLCWDFYNFIQLLQLRGQEYSYSSHYPKVPLLFQTIMLCTNYSAAFTLLGALSWLFGLPKAKEKRER